MIRSRVLPFICLAALALIPAWIVLAQAGAAQQMPAENPNDQPALFRTNANLVLVDVVVRDKGSAVQGLKAADFHIAEDGHEQAITTFEEHRATDSIQEAKVETLPAHTWSNAPHYAVTSAANVLLLDALNTPLADQIYVRRRMLQFLHTIPPGTRIAVFTLASKLRMVEGFTTDSSVIEKALVEARGRAEKSPVMDPMYDQQMQFMAMLADSGGISAQAVAAMNQFASEQAAFQKDLRLDMTIDAMEQLARYLSTIPGRKNLIWYTGAVPINVPPDITQDDPSGSQRDYGFRLARLSELMALARVAVYPVDARGLLNTPTQEAEATPLNPGILTQTPNSRPVAVPLQTTSQVVEQSNEQFLQSNFAEHSSMDQIANETGGRAFYNTNAMGEVVVKAMEDGANYYTIGYVPANKDYNGAYRKIDIQLTEGHAVLEYRHGYYANDPMQTAKLMPGRVSPLIGSMQHGILPDSQVLFQVRVVAAGDSSMKDEKLSPDPAGALAKTLKPPLTRYVSDFTIDPNGFATRPLPNGKIHREMELTEVAYDAEGIRLNYADGGFAVESPPGQAIHMRQEIDVPAGQVFLRIGVHDLISGRIGTLEIPLETAKQ